MFKAFVEADNKRSETPRYGENPAEFQTYLDKTRKNILRLLKDAPADHTFSPHWFERVTNGFSMSITPNLLGFKGFDMLRMRASITKNVDNPLSQHEEKDDPTLYVDVDIGDTETQQSLTFVTYKLDTRGILMIEQMTEKKDILPQCSTRHTQLIRQIVELATRAPEKTPVSLLRDLYGKIIDTH